MIRVTKRMAGSISKKHYGPNGSIAKPEEWARCHTKGWCNHNLAIERHNRTIKDHGLQRSHRIDQLCLDLLAVNEFFKRKTAFSQAQNLRRIKAIESPKSSQNLHPNDSNLYFLHQTEDSNDILVIKHHNENQRSEHTLTSNPYPCHQDRCQVRCSKCPSSAICAHSFICSCQSFAKQSSCKHLHLVAMKYMCVNPTPEHDYCGSRQTNQSELVEFSNNGVDATSLNSNGVEDLIVRLMKNFPPRSSLRCHQNRLIKYLIFPWRDVTYEPYLQNTQGFQRQVQQSLAKLCNRLIDQEIELEERRAILGKIDSVTNSSKSIKSAFPKLDTKRKRERAPSVFPQPKKKGQQIKDRIQPKTLQFGLLNECLESPLDQTCWMFAVSLKQSDV
ncbi:hypothetical protein TCAL_15597, partial [Tigriopus californicus]